HLEIRAEVPQPRGPALAQETRSDPALAPVGRGGNGAQRPAAQARPAQPKPSAIPKVGRNEPCPCGSGKKYKHCHGQVQ
ncbi:MAG: SEC-C metal-binding domain-containing protein, partial [Alphaproteobacteria bacterium]